MLRKTMTYTDFDGNERTETFSFHLSKAEVLLMHTGVNGGLQKTLQKMVDEVDNKKIAEMLQDIILKAYGEKSLDGKHFIKSQELSEAFSQTQAFSDLYVSLFLNPTECAAFMAGIIPKEGLDGPPPKTDLSITPN